MTILYTVIMMLSGLGAFLLGFRLMSDNIESLAQSKLRRLFSKVSKSRLLSAGMGLAGTAVVQSSSVTTAMTVSFVEAGVIGLSQAAAIIMGSNIGTTVTAHIVALKDFDFGKIATLLVFIGVLPLIFSKKNKLKNIGFILSGLGLVFMGIEYMESAMASIAGSEAVKNIFLRTGDPFLLILAGLLVTALVQSSSAVTSIIIMTVSAGLVIGSGGNSVYYVIIGTNIGTCITAFIASVGMGRDAKRAALIHVLFNLFGAVLFMIILLCWRSFAKDTLECWFPGYPSVQIAVFHTLFNTICTLLFLPHTGAFVRLASKLIPDKERHCPVKRKKTIRCEEKSSVRTKTIRKKYKTGGAMPPAVNMCKNQYSDQREHR